jgi:hypothetical protein
MRLLVLTPVVCPVPPAWDDPTCRIESITDTDTDTRNQETKKLLIPIICFKLKV